MGRSWTLFAPAFALVYGALYAAKRPVFIYYPLHREFALERLPEMHGPGMLWYGWLSAALLAGSTVTALVPAHWAMRVPPATTWLLTLFGMVLIASGELRGFLS